MKARQQVVVSSSSARIVIGTSSTKKNSHRNLHTRLLEKHVYHLNAILTCYSTMIHYLMMIWMMVDPRSIWADP